MDNFGNGYYSLGTWHLALGTWHLALGTWHLALGTWHLANNTHPSMKTGRDFIKTKVIMSLVNASQHY
jgi:hypothetical protein